MGSMDGRLIHLIDGDWRPGEAGSTIIPLGSLAERLTRVLRIREGEEFDAVIPGATLLRLAPRYTRRRLSELEIIESRAVEPRTGPAIVLFQAFTPRSFEDALALAARAGAWAVHPVVTRRSHTGRGISPKSQRWTAIAAQASEIARDLHGTVVGEETTIQGALSICSREGLLPLLLSASGEEKLISRSVLGRISSGRGAAIFVGPEGGFTSSEESVALENGALAVTLGKRIIPADSAGGLAIFAIHQAISCGIGEIMRPGGGK